jgi:uncharacterized protein YukE
MIDVRGKIAAALESRRAYQDRIDKLYDAWDALAHWVDTLADTITRTGGEIAGLERRAAEGVTAEGARELTLSAFRWHTNPVRSLSNRRG